MHNQIVGYNGTLILRAFLVAATGSMFALHLGTTTLLKHGVRAVTLLRWEIAYYVLLLAAVTLPSFRGLLAQAVVLAVLHLAAWGYSELHPEAGMPRPAVLRAVRIFDSAEAIVLAWILVAMV